MTGPPDGTGEKEGESARSVPRGFTAPAPSVPPDPPEHPSAPTDAPEQYSALVGFMSVPVHPRLPIRRSTLLMVLAFIGLGTLLYFNPPQSTATGAVVHTPNGDYFVPGATPVDASTTTTVPPTTTTTTTTARPVATTTTTGQPTTTAVPRTVPTSTPTSLSTSTTSTVTAATTTTTLRIQGAGTGSTTTTTTP
jgi:hypothetical protein